MDRYLDADLFRLEAVSDETRAINLDIARKLSEATKLGVTDLAATRLAFARGDGPIPATAKSPRARTLEAPAEDGGVVRLRVIAPESPRGVYLHIHGGGWPACRIEARDVAQGNSSLLRNQQVRPVHCAFGARKVGCRAGIVKRLIEKRPWA